MKEYGYFSNNGYVITDRNTPRHWYNYLFNGEYITSVSQIGFGKSFAKVESGHKLPFIEDRAVYIVDENRFWQATGLPVHTSVQHYHCEHRIGCTDIVLTQQRIKSECRFFVGNEGKREFLRIKITNESRQTKTLKIIPYYATDIDNKYHPQGEQCGRGYFKDDKNCVIGHSSSQSSKNGNQHYFAYLMSTDIVTGYDTRNSAFIGTYGTKQQPKALFDNNGCSNSDCIAEKTCFALENTITLAPGESKTIYYTIGIENDEMKIPQLLPAEIEAQYDTMQAKYATALGSLYIRSPWDDLDNLCNDWLKYQSTLGSQWARLEKENVADQLADIECLSTFDAKLATEHLYDILALQHNSGYMPDTEPVGTAAASLSLITTVYAITKELGTFDLLQQKIPFSNGEVASVYEHTKRAITYLWNNPAHGGLIKQHYAIDETEVVGKGANIYLSIVFVRASKRLSQMANWMGRETDARSATHYAQEMENRINRYSWDGDRYIYAISDQKRLIGTKECTEGKLYALPQIWSILSKFDKERCEIAIDTLEKELNTDLGLLYCTPPFSDHTSLNLPGIGENGGIDLLTAVWKMVADSLLRRNDKIEEGLRKVLPTHNEYFETCGEPYTMFDYYFGYETDYRIGKPSASWCSSTGPRLLHTLVNFIFGLQPEFGGLILRPCLPPSWKDCSISKEFRGCRYNIHYIQKDNGICNTIDSIYVNGIETNRDLPIKPQSGKTLNIEVIMRT